MSTPTTTPGPRRRLSHRWLFALIAVLVVIAGGGLYSVTRSDPRQIAIFDSGVPCGEDKAALNALEFASSAGIDMVINYSAINAPRDCTTVYLDDAHRLGVKVVISLKDLLGPTDLDPDQENVNFHHQYGLNTNAQVTGVIKEFDANDALWGYYTGDELPAEASGPDNLDKWLDPLKQRNDQVHRLSKKPTMASFYRNPRSFLKKVAGAADHTMMDYYPYPEAPVQIPGVTYGKESDMKQVSADTAEVAGDKSWSAIQGYSYYASEPEKVTDFQFPATPPADSNLGAPNAAWMIGSAKLALAGGARNLAIFSYPYAAGIHAQRGHRSQLDEIKAAVTGIRQLPEWN